MAGEGEKAATEALPLVSASLANEKKQDVVRFKPQ